MSSHDKVNAIFREPEQWGLRGDPFLWKELRDRFLLDGLPETTRDFETRLGEIVQELIGAPLAVDTHVFVERYNQGGMSSGHVAPSWWRTTGFPLLRSRYAQASDGKIKLAVQRELQNSLKSTVELDAKGYVRIPEHNILADVKMEYFEQDLRDGDGDELRAKFLAAHSSTALAVNCFAWFRGDGKLHLLGIMNKNGVHDLRFERKCPIFRGGKAPHLDVWIECEGEIIAVESKLTEYFTKTKPEFSDAYERLGPPGFSEQCWWDLYQEAKKGVRSYLDRAQLLKHYFGLRKYQQSTRFTGQMKFLYLFWEPTNAGEIEICKQHRSELAEFHKSVATSTIKFHSMSYLELWNAWENAPELADHVRHLRERYQLKVGFESVRQ